MVGGEGGGDKSELDWLRHPTKNRPSVMELFSFLVSSPFLLLYSSFLHFLL